MINIAPAFELLLKFVHALNPYSLEGEGVCNILKYFFVAELSSLGAPQ